jgi:subtilisin family serine protease
MRRYQGRRLPLHLTQRAIVATLLLILASMTGGVQSASAGSARSPKVDKRLAEVVDKDLADGGGSVRVIAYGPGAKAVLAGAGARHVKQLDLLGAASGEVPAAAVDVMAGESGVSALTVDPPVVTTALGDGLVPLYPTIDGAASSWASAVTGAGVGVAVIDSGIAAVADLGSRVVQVPFGAAAGSGDAIGHGTFVASVIGGRSADGRYVGLAPDARLFALDVDSGHGI